MFYLLAKNRTHNSATAFVILEPVIFSTIFPFVLL